MRADVMPSCVSDEFEIAGQTDDIPKRNLRRSIENNMR
jgi:hypothetical protein